ncbi:hypothetical protein AR457_37805 [Streptomyces agglomeratus]|uniref:hypothetical protein n=1 Tax=Streptomyces agglomeratus TaxID=285458 RepID=UPI0008542849|nr:hypothetical protein [Streptomyces agglomeratus]OEJ22968.1 hypothetical protein AR457_37805 [Streptomyces agglomeratus]
MNRQGRGSTGPGRPSALPDHGYEPPAPVRELPDGGLVVAFHGDDDRRRVFNVSRLPLPGWHPALAAVVSERTGPGGGLRTFAAATTGWGSLSRLVKFLGALPEPPATLDQLTPSHLQAFHDHRTRATPVTALRDMSEARLLFALPALRDQVSAEVLDHIQRRLPSPREPEPSTTVADAEPSRPGNGAKRLTSGYSDGELARLLAALRADAARIRDRIRAGEDLLRRYQSDPLALDDNDRDLGGVLERMAATGQVPTPPAARPSPFCPERQELTGQLFLTLRDLPPLMMLTAALSERNGETMKELPVRHRLLEDRAVELVIVKRRRGTRRWFETVTWEIGAPGRELHNPGGFYLLMLELTARSRQWSGSPLLWSVWRNGYGAGLGVPDNHFAPFQDSLSSSSILPTAWVANRPRPLLADPQSTTDGPDATPPTIPAQGLPLQVSFNRIKTSMEVRRTKRMGGHLPSAAKSNSMPVLFRNYLSGDPVITAWAEEVLGEALVDAEQAARQAHERAAKAAGGGPRVLPGPADAPTMVESGIGPETARQIVDGELDTGWTACVDHDQHPLTGKTCQVTFLDCFHCGNCLVTRDHLPRLLALLDALSQRRRELPEEVWWPRYGPAWVAIRQDILAKFTPAELQRAQADKPHDALLDLIENPWELP